MTIKTQEHIDKVERAHFYGRMAAASRAVHSYVIADVVRKAVDDYGIGIGIGAPSYRESGPASSTEIEQHARWRDEAYAAYEAATLIPYVGNALWDAGFRVVTLGVETDPRIEERLDQVVDLLVEHEDFHHRLPFEGTPGMVSALAFPLLGRSMWDTSDRVLDDFLKVVAYWHRELIIVKIKRRGAIYENTADEGLLLIQKITDILVSPETQEN